MIPLMYMDPKKWNANKWDTSRAASAKESCIECVTEKWRIFCLAGQKVLSAKKMLTIRVYILMERRFFKYVSENKQNFISG